MCSGNRPSSAADPAPILSIPHLFASILVRRVPRALSIVVHPSRGPRAGCRLGFFGKLGGEL